MTLRSMALGFGTRAAGFAVVLGIVVGSVIGLDEWADDLTTHGPSATATAADGPQDTAPPGA